MGGGADRGLVSGAMPSGRDGSRAAAAEAEEGELNAYGWCEKAKEVLAWVKQSTSGILPRR